MSTRLNLYAQGLEISEIVDQNYSSKISRSKKIKNADLLILFTRFRDLPAVQMKYIDDYL